jgi:CBS domain-containing protein
MKTQTLRIRKGDAAMKIRDIMTPGVECISPTESIAEAAERMRKLDVGSLPVCGDENKLVGIITDRDITIRATAHSCDPCCTCVGDVMTPDIVTCFEDEDVQVIVDAMESKQIRRLAVLNRDKQLVGIVSLGDLAVRTPDERVSGETLERVSQPTMTT